MTYTDAISKGSNIINKNYWLLFIPIISDTVLLIFKYLSSGILIDTSRIPQFQLKITIPSSLPSLKNVIDAFPDLVSYNTNTGFQNSILSFTNTFPSPWNTVYLICCIVVLSIFTAFLHGGFMGCMAKTYKTDEKASIKDFLNYGSYYWSRFFGINVLGILAILFTVALLPIVIIFFIVSFSIFYLSYALVWDDISVLEAITRAISRFTSRFGNTLGFIIYIAFLLGMLSLIIVPLSRINVFLGLILYNSCACYFVAGTLVMYAGERIDPEISTEPTDDGHIDVKI